MILGAGNGTGWKVVIIIIAETKSERERERETVISNNEFLSEVNHNARAIKSRVKASDCGVVYNW